MQTGCCFGLVGKASNVSCTESAHIPVAWFTHNGRYGLLDDMGSAATRFQLYPERRPVDDRISARLTVHKTRFGCAMSLCELVIEPAS